jgi:DNA-binding NarL/FixJ family response regulator
MAKIKVLVADDHRLVLEAVTAALANEEGIEVVATASSGYEALSLIARTVPDVILLDVAMPRMDGIRCLELIRARHPKVKVVIVSGLDDPRVVRQALLHGASAFVTKSVDPRDLAAILRQTTEGTVYAAPPMGEWQPAEAATLTRSELAVLRAAAQGLPNKQIAAQLSVTQQTVKFHLTKIYRKLGVANRTEASQYAYRHGLLDPPVAA